MKRTHLYLPITSQPRELDSKLLLALVAKESGIEPIFGYKSIFQHHFSSLPQGYLMPLNARQRSSLNFRLRKFGHRVLVLDEEALVRQSDEIFFRKHHKDAFHHVDQILSWGEDDRDIWQHSGLEIHGGVTITGNPRVDLMRREFLPYYDKTIAEIRAAHGDYILLNTNFSTVNNLTPQGRGVRLAQWQRDDRGQRIETDFLQNKRATFENVQGIVRELAQAIAPLTLLIRPHPNEDHAPWLAAAGDSPNVHVTFEGGIVPWLIGAHAMIHNNCTTAVEAAIIGTPVLNYRPWTSEYDNPLSHAFGQDCSSVTDLIAAIRNLPRDKSASLTAAQRAVLEHHIASVTGPLSCERIVDVIRSMQRDRGEAVPEGIIDRYKILLQIRMLWLKRFIAFYRSRSGRDKRRFLRRNYPHLSLRKMDYEMLGYSKEQFDLFMRQFPELTEAEIDAKIARMSATLGRFSGMRSKKLRDHLFTIV